MKTIQPVQIWINGKIQLATIFSLICINDNLLNQAIFYYELLDEQLNSLSVGNLTMIEPDYSIDWVNNNAAYSWAALQLGLTITGDYIPVLPE
jgi:hypothetical protein